MNIQIFGTSKCFDTKKAQRYFKERRVKFQLVDLSKYGISRGELTSVKNALGLDALINSKHPDAPLLTYLAYDADKLEAAGRSPAAAHPHRPQRETGYRGLLPRCLENLGITGICAPATLLWEGCAGHTGVSKSFDTLRKNAGIFSRDAAHCVARAKRARLWTERRVFRRTRRRKTLF